MCCIRVKMRMDNTSCNSAQVREDEKNCFSRKSVLPITRRSFKVNIQFITNPSSTINYKSIFHQSEHGVKHNRMLNNIFWKAH